MARKSIKKGKLIEITYLINDTDDNLLERIDLPVNYIHKMNSGMYPVIEDALEGHNVGDCITCTLTPEQGFGQPNPELFFTDDVENVPEQFRRIGAEVEMQGPNGENKLFYVSKIEDGKLTVDGNHPFAGKTLKFIVTVVAIRDPSGDELSGIVPTGQAAGLPSQGIDPAIDKTKLN